MIPGEVVAVLGLGEAGVRYAADLVAAGVPVVGYDPAAAPQPAGMRSAASPAEAVAGATIVLSMNSSRVAEAVAQDAAPALSTGALYADLNAGSAELKERVGAVVAAAGGCFADGALLAPVPRHGLRTPILVSGPGRHRLGAFLAKLGAAVEDAGPHPGAASFRKLLRSVFMKGLAAVITESLELAQAAGQGAWLRNQITAELGGDAGALVDRLVAGTHQHARRRLDEMGDAAGYAARLGVPAPVIRATIERLEALAGEMERDDDVATT